MKFNELGLVLIDAVAPTFKVIGTSTVLGVAAEEEITILPVYVPCARPAEFTLMVTDPGAVALLLSTNSQKAPTGVRTWAWIEMGIDAPVDVLMMMLFVPIPPTGTLNVWPPDVVIIV